MTEQEFLRYKGLKTKGSHGGYNFEGGIVVGYGKNYKPTDFQSFIAFFNDDRGWDKKDLSEEISFDDKGLFLGERPNGTFLYVSLENLVIETEKEEKELDLTKILEGCEGIELWSNVFGLCKLEIIVKQARHPIVLSITNDVGVNISECISKDGLYNNAYNGECILWPSETNRDWSTFKKPIKDDDWFACTDGNGVYTVIKYGNISESWKYIIPYDKFRPDLTKEELKKLSIV